MPSPPHRHALFHVTMHLPSRKHCVMHRVRAPPSLAVDLGSSFHVAKVRTTVCGDCGEISTKLLQLPRNFQTSSKPRFHTTGQLVDSNGPTEESR